MGMKSRFQKVVHVLFVLMLIAWAMGQIVRDRYWLTGLMFYIPTPVILVSLFVFVMLNLKRGARKRAIVFAAFSVLPMIVVGGIENQFRNQFASNSAQLKAVHWNVMGGKLGWEKIKQTLDTHAADLIVLSEIPWYFNANEFPDVHVLKLGLMAVISRFPLIHLEDYTLGKQQVHAIRWEPIVSSENSSEQISVVLLIADLPSSIRYHRHPMLVRLLNTLEETKADLLFGDLNAPRRSLALSNLPVGYHHAYDSAGSGWGYTWPAYLSTYSIDHTIHSRKIKPLAYSLHNTIQSDHRLQLFEFDVLRP